MAGAVQISEIGAGDLEALARFLGREASAPGEQAALGLRDTRYYRWFLLDNPAQPAGVPCGWIARNAAGEMVGSKFCAAERFLCAGQVQTLLMGGGFYVSSEHRGLGLALMRRYLEQGQHHALYASTMNEVSGALYEHYGGYPVPHTDHEWLGVLHYGPVVEELLVRRFGRPGLARLLARAAVLRPSSIRGAPRGTLARVTSSAESRRSHRRAAARARGGHHRAARRDLPALALLLRPRRPLVRSSSTARSVTGRRSSP